MENKNKIALEILDDVLMELQGEESNKPIGEGVTSEEYVLEQLQKLWVLLRDGYVSEETLEEMTRNRNKLNRQISTLKKATLNREYGECPECQETELVSNVGKNFTCNNCEHSWKELTN